MAKRFGAIVLHRHIGADAGQFASVATKAALVNWLRKEFRKLATKVGHLDPILRSSRPGHAWSNRAQVEREVHRVIDLTLGWDSE